MAAALKSSLGNWRASLSVYWNRRMLIILLMGFASGLPLLLTLSTLSIWLKEEGVSKTAIGLFALVGLPYSLKFLWAPIIDRGRIPWLTCLLGQRRSWLVVIELGLMASIVALGSFDPQTDLYGIALAALVVAFFSASQDVVIDAYRIEILSDVEQGAGAAVTQVGYRFGLLAAGAGALFMAEQIPWKWVYAAEAGFLVIGLATVLASPEPAGTGRGKTEPRTGRRFAAAGAWLKEAVVAPIADFVRRPGWVVILLFILLFKFGDAFAGVMANPFYLEMQFTKTEIAQISKIFGMFATLAGVFLGGVVVYRYGVMKGLLYCGLLQMVSNLMYAAQAVVGHDLGMLALTIGIENLSGGMGSAAFVAYMSSLCGTGYAGTQYALMSALMSMGRTTLSASSGWLADHVDWVSFFVISTVVAVPGLLLLVWMMHAFPTEEIEAAAQEAGRASG